MIGDIQRIFHCLFEIIGRTPFQHIICRKSIRSFFDIGDILLFPLLYSTIIAHGVIGYKLEHSFGQGMIDQIGNILFTVFLVYF